LKNIKLSFLVGGFIENNLRKGNLNLRNRGGISYNEKFRQLIGRKD